MTDNYNKMYKYMVDLGLPIPLDKGQMSELFFDVQLIRRGKDHPGLPAANYTFKTYYIDSMEQFERYYPEIKTCCEMFGLRAYISVNAKEKTEATRKTLERYAHDIVTNDYRKPWKDFSSVCGGLDGREKRWIIDVDDCDDIDTYLNKICETVRMCESGYDDPIVTIIPTRSGFHIITHPFNMKRFNDICDALSMTPPGIKKNHITLLYENLEVFKLNQDYEKLCEEQYKDKFGE